MKDKIEPSRSGLIRYHVRYVKERKGLDRNFIIEATSPENLCMFLNQTFPGRGDFTFNEVKTQ